MAEAVGLAVAHMWFGDLVSPKWWEHLRENELYAEIMAEMVTNGRPPTASEREQIRARLEDMHLLAETIDRFLAHLPQES